MKTVIIYKSKTGFVKKYADWLKEELSADIFEVTKADPDILSGYDAVIYGGSLHAVGIIGADFIKNNFDKLKGKKVAVFSTGASPFSEGILKKVADANFTDDQQKLIKFFYLRGGFNYEKLPISDKILMIMLKSKIRLKKILKMQLSSDEKGMFAAYSKPVDFTNKKYIQGIVSYVNS